MLYDKMVQPNVKMGFEVTATAQSSLTFAGNTRSLPKKEASERRSNWVCSCLALKFKDLTGKGVQGQTLQLIGPRHQRRRKKVLYDWHQVEAGQADEEVVEVVLHLRTGQDDDGEAISWNELNSNEILSKF